MISACGTYCVSFGGDKVGKLWNLTNWEKISQFESHQGEVISLDWSADNRMIVSGAKDNKIKIWNTLGQLKHTVIDERFGEISALKIDNNTMTVIFGDSKGQVFKFSLSF